VEEAWEFIKWMVSLDALMIMNEVQQRYAHSRGRLYVPGMSANMKINEIIYEKFTPDHERIKSSLRIFLDLMPRSKFRPVTPVGQLLWDEHIRAVDFAVRHIYTPKEALDIGARNVQRELDRLFESEKYKPLVWKYPIMIICAVLVALLIVIVVRVHRQPPMGRMAKTEALAGYMFAAPWIVGFVIFTAGPVLFSIILSFTKYDVLHPAKFVGFDNYKWLLTKDPLFWRSLGNTLFMVLGVPLGMAVGLGIALLLNANVKGMAVYRTIYYLPAIVPTVASSILWIWVLHPTNGLINTFLKMIHIQGPYWLQSPAWSKPSLILMGLWGAGAGMIIWLAGLKGIPEYLYEAAEIDGANWWGKFRHVTLPMLTPYIFFNLVMGIIGTFQIFAQAYIMTQGGPADSTLFYVYYLFNNAFRYLKMGYASAMAWILFVIIFILTVINFKLAPKWVYYEAERPR